MARLALWLVCGAITCGGVGIAVASPQFVSTFSGTYSAKTPGTSSGVDALATWSDPAEPGGKPKEIQKIEFRLNPGSRLDTSALPACKASDEDVQIRAVRACPANTKTGSCVRYRQTQAAANRLEPKRHFACARVFPYVRQRFAGDSKQFGFDI